MLHQEVSYEGLNIPFIIQDGIMSYFFFNTLLEVNELMSTLIGFGVGVLLGYPLLPLPLGNMAC